MSVRKNLENGAYKSKLDYNANRLLYSKDEGRLCEVFRLDLLEENGVSYHPKADKVWQLAWAHGHSAGLYEVLYYFEEFVELIKEE